jgi:aspartyl-tRNA(Asn)/glutamyl-tRNA(Gln) amidotransferase subunit B
MSIYEKYEVIVGLEVHAQLMTKSKAYSTDANEYGASPNSLLSPITLGLPGTLPKLNKHSVELAVKIGLALNCGIREYNEFSRKNYFYADLPKGYQITQFDTPICNDGWVEIATVAGKKVIQLERIHLEEDAGKSIHDIDPFYTLIDLNRAGVPLIEIVSRPDLRSGEEAAAYLTEIRKLVRYLDICDGNMEEGSLRCDANISIRVKGTDVLNQRVEVKNMNSIRNVKRAIEYEFTRQVEAVEKGEKIVMETRNFDALTGTTSSMRSKEMAHDYRYFPEPDLLPIHVS